RGRLRIADQPETVSRRHAGRDLEKTARPLRLHVAPPIQSRRAGQSGESNLEVPGTRAGTEIPVHGSDVARTAGGALRIACYLSVASKAATNGRWSEPTPQFGRLST